MNVSVARVFFKPSDIGKEPSEAFLNTFESPATVELGLCFLLLILSSIFTRLELRVFKPWLVRPVKNRVVQSLLRLPGKACSDKETLTLILSFLFSAD